MICKHICRYTQLNDQTVLFLKIQLCIICFHLVWISNCSVWPTSGATTLSNGGPGSDDKEGVLCIPQSSRITGVPPSDCLMWYPGHLLRGFYPSVEIQSVYSSV